ncbi:hypothetical protein [Jannaschia sp. LMIT008]|uniref:hypothetical protein n=1 Tax=Jannaschia maritima TaxID=3032585 RepID=UPI002811C1C5|nr:hypothetical protein [Jannaschia sp. LMIT008]
MPMKTYFIARHQMDPEPRMGHIVRLSMSGYRSIDIALRRCPRGYLADHPRSGRSLKALDQVTPWGQPVRLTEAIEGLTAQMADRAMFDAVKAAAAELPILNASFQ